MNRNNFSGEIIISIAFIILIILFLDPFMFWMPDSAIYMMMPLLVALFVVFAGFVWKEKADDERDELHKMIAGRVGYLAGVGVLVLGVVFEALTAHVDVWLITALAVMVLAKLAGLVYGRIRH